VSESNPNLQPGQSAGLNSSLGLRTAVLAGGLALECFAIQAIPHLWSPGHRGMLAVIAFCGALFFFGRGRLGNWRAGLPPIQRPWLVVHAFAIALVAASYVFLLRHATAHPALTRAVVFAWFLGVALLPLSLVGALFSLKQAWKWLAALGAVWLYAAAIGLSALYAADFVQLAWDAPDSRFGRVLQAGTYHGARALLSLFYRGVVSDQPTAILGTPKFQVQIASLCAGMEGLALMLILSVGWLIFARRELRLSRAIWLVPVALAAVWGLNLVRIAALIAIGDAGYESIAVHGFHSVAGWILFNAVALAFLVAANRIQWLRKDAIPASVAGGVSIPASVGDRNPAAVYLLPFLAILAASLVAQALSNGFEWLYPLRLVAALAVLWAYRREYRRIDLRFGWLGLLAGAAVFAMWLALSRFVLSADGGATLATGLAQLTTWQRIGWITARAAAAVITVPLAEELAFRGYIARRIVSEDVESVSYQRLGLVPIIVSSLVFGVMHGRLWLAGVVAGVIFALVAKLRNRLGEAAAAHATANLLIAIWVLARGDYSLW